MAKQCREKKVVLASGVFDLLHLGHVKFLEAAKKAGGKNAKLFVIVARDRTVEKIKGRKPIIPENQRRTLINSLKVVDKAILGYEMLDIAEVINKMKPDLIVLGHDQKTMEKNVKEYCCNNAVNIDIIKIEKFGEDSLDSSSKILRKIINNFSR
ncbi:MAG: FAD synthase [Candidatus Lokiarchaeota archaeon]|nr:FAD synthase [Candidatus Lokiarchaeota archaeon]